MERDLLKWMSDLKFSVVDNEYHIDFCRVDKNVDAIKKELELLNTLIGSKKIEEDFITLVNQNPNVVDAIPVLLALRSQDVKVTKEEWNYLRHVNFVPQIGVLPAVDFLTKEPNEFAIPAINILVRFMKETSLFDLLANKKVTNLVDYARGVEVGLAAQERKKTDERFMLDAVEKHLLDAGFVQDKTYFKNMTIKDIDTKWQLGLDEFHEIMWDQMNYTKIDNAFDFVVKTKNCTYAIATNFYGGFGSGGYQLNEQLMCTARAYLFFARSVRSRIEHGNKNFKFLWIVDGSALLYMDAHYFDDAFHIEDTVYNLKELEDGAFKQILV